MCVIVCVCAHRSAAPLSPAGSRTCLAASVSSCTRCDATLWFREPEGTRCTESENYYASFKDRLHCCSSGTPLCSRSMTQCLQKPLMQEQAVRLHPPLYCCAVEAACFIECRFSASKISCNGWLKWGGGCDYTDHYKTWECWKQLWVIMPEATGDMSVELGKNGLLNLM